MLLLIIPISYFFIKIKIRGISWFTTKKNNRGLTFGADRYHLPRRSVRLASDCGVSLRECSFQKLMSSSGLLTHEIW